MKIRVLIAASLLSFTPLAARAHCDTLDGPVVKTARAALDANEIEPVLAWVKPAHEREIRAAFRKAVDARKKNPQAHEPSDHRFLETLVRVHRAGEGAPFTGLKAAGEGVGAAVQAADRAIETKDISGTEAVLTSSIRSGLHERFAKLTAMQPPGHDVVAGRAWVDAYVEYVHYVERLELLARGGGDHHGKAGEAGHAGHAAGSAGGTVAAQETQRHAHGH